MIKQESWPFTWEKGWYASSGLFEWTQGPKKGQLCARGEVFYCPGPDPDGRVWPAPEGKELVGFTIKLPAAEQDSACYALPGWGGDRGNGWQSKRYVWPTYEAAKAEFDERRMDRKVRIIPVTRRVRPAKTTAPAPVEPAPKFKPGDKVRCIDVKGAGSLYSLELGKVYTVTRYYGNGYLDLKGSPGGWLEKRFEHVTPPTISLRDALDDQMRGARAVWGGR